MPRTDRASRLMHAPLTRVFDAFVKAAALEKWLPPANMSGTLTWFDPRPGGSYRLVLTYLDATTSEGKSSAGSDIVDVRYLEIVPNDRVVQAVNFETAAPEFGGTMTMTWTVQERTGGTLVEIIADHVPDGISAEEHARGIASSLESLARLVES